MGPVPPGRGIGGDQSEIGFMDQAGGAKGVYRSLVAKAGPRQRPEFVVDHGQETVQDLAPVRTL
jgi:hypothetical protein